MESKLRAIYASTVRDLLKQASEYEIYKEDVVAIFKEGESYVLIYGKNK